MPASELQKRAVYFLIFAVIVTLLLILFPIGEDWLHTYIAQFGFEMKDGSAVVKDVKDGFSPDPMIKTTVSLVVNFLHIIKVILWMALVIACVRFLSHLIMRTALRNAPAGEISSLLKTVLSVIVYIVAFFIIFQSQYPLVELAPLFTGSTIIGIVVGLALQDTLGNLFAGLALQADQSFQVGDVIAISNRGTGVVESVSWRGVKVRTFQNKLLVMSNAALGKETIEVAPRGNLNARVVNFYAAYTESPARIIKLVREAVRQAENVSAKMRPVVRIKNFGADSVEWEIKYWLDDYTKHNDTDALVRQRIWYAYNREGVEHHFTERHVYIESHTPEIVTEEEINTHVERLSSLSIFSPLSSEEISKLAEAAKARVYAPGEVIVRAGQEGNSMFVIKRGSVNVQIVENKLQKVVNTLVENDFFGEMSLLTGEPRSATVVAAEETEVLQIRKNALKPILETNPKLVESFGEIIEERKVTNRVEMDDDPAEKSKKRNGVMLSIRKFFGLKK